MATILAVDDEADMLDVISYNLQRVGHTVLKAQSGAAALEILDGLVPDLIISDVMMPGMDGVEFCGHVRARQELSLTPFLFVTAKTQSEDKYRGLRAGADDYIAKPFDLADLMARVDGRLAHRRHVLSLRDELDAAQAQWRDADEPDQLRTLRAQKQRIVDAVRDAGHPDYRPPTPEAAALLEKVARFEERFPKLSELRRTTLVGESAAHLELFEEILISASSPDPALIIGETGTGKTATAAAIHQLGPRSQAPFLTVNCAELAAGDPTIAIGKLFGYGKNSGLPGLPKEGRPGLLEECDGGVLFLDEVASLPAQAQSLLLLPLEGRPFSPAVGTGPARTVDVKFIMATNRDLAEEVERGEFPRDLYERMAGEVLRIAPLCERPDDVHRLLEHFMAELTEESASVPSLSADVRERLLAYSWPGNVRELRRVVRQACRRASLNGRDVVETSDLPAEVVGAEPSDPGTAPAPMKGNPLPADTDGVFSGREQGELVALRATGFRVSAAEVQLGYSGRSRTLSHRLRGLCLKALCVSRFDVEAAAGLLTGGTSALTGPVTRRLHAVLDGMAQKLDQGDEHFLSHLLVEHRPFALETLAHLRTKAEAGTGS
jgi:DNA-binding NtrC family response regulator